MNAQDKLVEAVEQLVEAVTGGKKISFKRLVEIKTLVAELEAAKVKNAEARELYVLNEN